MTIHYNNQQIEVVPEDRSYRYRKIMGEHTLTLSFTLAEHREIPLGSSVIFGGMTYTLEAPPKIEKNGERNFHYSATFESPQAQLKKYRLHNTLPSDSRLKFPLTARPAEFLKLIVENMNLRDSGWVVGDCIDRVEKLISFNHNTCLEALQFVADAFETEWEVDNRTIHLRKIERHKTNPLPLSYGRTMGLKPGISRQNYDNSKPLGRMYVQGGERNIDFSRYKNKELLLPKNTVISFDGEHFDDDPAFDPDRARPYITDDNGYYVKRLNPDGQTNEEGSIDLSHIYPMREGVVTAVEKVMENGEEQWDIIDTTIPSNLDYNDCRIAGERAVILFQSGMLVGREFEIMQTDDKLSGYVHADRRFKLVAADMDGMRMPNDTFKPKARVVDQAGNVLTEGDKYAVFGIQMPDQYIEEASLNMLKEAVRNLFENEDPRYSFKVNVWGKWARENWDAISSKVVLGGYVEFRDDDIQPDPVLIRIVGVKDYVNKIHYPEIELSNVSVGAGVSSMNKVEQDEVVIEDKFNSSLSFTRRRFRDAQQTIAMLEGAVDGFSRGINPVSVQTMALLLGWENLQFRFVTSRDNPETVSPGRLFTYDNATQTFTAGEGIIQHLTLGITDIKPSHAPQEYNFFDVAARTYQFDEPDKAYYLYAHVASGSPGHYRFVEEGLQFREGSAYNLLVGILSSEFEGERSFAPLYGFTEVLPGQITTDRILSNDGKTYFDLSTGEIGGNLKFLSSGGEEKKVADLDRFVTEDIQQQVDGKIESWFQSADPSTAWDTDEKRLRHTGDMWYNSSSKTLRRYTGSRWATIEDQTAINAYDTASQAYTAASAAQSTADGKSRVFVATPYPPYSVGDLWVDGDELYRCVTARASGSFDKNDWPLATKYDNTKTVIDGGLITSGTVQLAGQQSDIVAGITGLPRTGETSQSDTDVRIWAGASKENRESAPFRILQDGSFVAQKANIEGTIKAENGRIGRFEIGASRIGVESDSANSSNTGMSLCNYFIRFRDSNSLIALGNSVSSTAENYGEVLLRLECNKSHVLTDITNNIGCIINVTGCPEIYPGLGRNDAVRIEKGNFVMEVKEGSSTPGTAGSIILQPFYYSSRGEVPTRGRTVIALTDGTDSSIQLQAGYNGQTIVVINLTDKEKSIQVANSRLQRNLQVWRSVILTFIKDYGWCPQGD